jgi:hypothetical protein
MNLERLELEKYIFEDKKNTFNLTWTRKKMS